MYSYEVEHLLKFRWEGDHCPSRHLLEIGIMTLNVFEHWTRAVFLRTAESFQLQIEIVDKHDIVGKLLIVSNSLKFEFPFGK